MGVTFGRQALSWLSYFPGPFFTPISRNLIINVYKGKILNGHLLVLGHV